MKRSHTVRRATAWRIPLALAALLAVAAPAQPQTVKAKTGGSGASYSTIEVSPFAGYQWFQIYANERTRYSKFDGAPVFGFRVTEDFSKYIGLEESFTVGFNNFRLRPWGASDFTKVDARNYSLSITPVLHMTPRTSKFRPFLVVGPGITWYRPDETVRTEGIPGVVLPANPPRTKYGPALVYGIGLKYNASRRVGLRFDIRNNWTQGYRAALLAAPTGLGTIFAPKHGTETALAATAGITFRFGHRDEVAAPRASAAPPPPAPAPAPAPAPPAEIRVSAIEGAHDVCPGEEVRLSVRAGGWRDGVTPTYQWMVDGQPVAGAGGSTFSLPTAGASGVRSVAVRVSAGGASKASDPVAVRVKESGAPAVRFASLPASIAAGARLPLSATATPSACGGPATIRYSASEGTVSGDVYDSGSVAFDRANRLKQQVRRVRLTATATDRAGQSGSAQAELNVTLSPEARRLDDIVFPAGSARVNNCAKRLLLESLSPMLRDDPNATVVLIGHRDTQEKGVASLDRARVLNAAAVLSAGAGICPQLELSRVKAKTAGTDQSSPVRPLLCGASTDVKERSGQAVQASDKRAQFRRVEVWVVPGGAEAPAAAAGAQALPEADVKKLGCPK
jgi:outer membrane protein W